jgi:hypothetical protein
VGGSWEFQIPYYEVLAKSKQDGIIVEVLEVVDLVV